MKFSVGADDDPFVKAKVQSASASQEQTSCMYLTMRVNRIVAAVLAVVISSPMAARLIYHDAGNSIWQHKQVDRFGEGHVSRLCSAVNVRSNDQHLLHCARDETVENGRTVKSAKNAHDVEEVFNMKTRGGSKRTRKVTAAGYHA